MYNSNTYGTRYNIVSRNSFIYETTIFTHLNVTCNTEKHVYA